MAAPHAPGPPPAPPSSSSTSRASTSSTSTFSPNHPTNLRKQAKASLDASFSVRSYLGAAAQLLEKAESSDRQGHLEQAFVNYLKAANVAAFITKHPEWASIQQQRGPTYFRYQDFMQKITDVISRATRIEATLKEREERNAVLQAQQRTAAAASAVQQARDQQMNDGELTAPPPPAEPGPAKQLRTSTSDQGDAAAALASASIVLPREHVSDSRPGSGAATPRSNQLAGSSSPESGEAADHVSSLSSRLAALRTAGMGAAASSSSGSGSVAMGKRLSEPIAPARRSTIYEEEAGDSIPSVPDGFADTYPSLDDFDKKVPSPLPSAPTSEPSTQDSSGSGGMFPTAPSHAPGNGSGSGGSSGSRRPLPNPPAPPTDLALGRDVPKPFSVTSSSVSDSPQKPVGMTPSSSRSSIPSLPASSRPSSLIPGSPRSSAAPRARPPIPAAPASAAAAAAAGETVGAKPSLPRGNHIKVEELWQLLNPGFERVAGGGEDSTSTSSNDSSASRMVRKRGLDILLLDLRSRDDFEAGRVGQSTSTDVVCLDGSLTLKRGMTSSDLEDKLLLSPPAEQTAFANRHRYDAVVLYDRSSRLLGPPNPAQPQLSGWASYEEAVQAYERLDVVVKAIYEHEFEKSLKVAPFLLVGGWDSWWLKVEKRGQQAPPPSRGGGMNGSAAPGTRTSRSGSVTNGGASPELMRRYQEDELLKKQRRQGFVLPSSSPSSNGGGGGGWSAAGYQAPSMPAKAYQSPGTPSAPPPGAPGFPPTAAGSGSTAGAASSSASSRESGYFPSQPSIPYGEPPNHLQHYQQHHPVAQRPSTSSGQQTTSFDYPQLRSTQHHHHAAPAPPPAAVSSNGVSNRSMTTSATAQDSPHHHQHRPAPTSTSSTALGGGGSRMNVRPLPSFDTLRIGLTGLKNVGNSCYQNATLQCLSATIPLAKYMLDGSYRRDVNAVNPLGTQGQLAEAFAHLVKVLWSEQYTFVSPVTFREQISRFAPSFRGFEQHDSQEFLAFLMDGLHEDLNRVVHKPPPVEMSREREEELETLPQQVASVKEWTIYRMRNDSVIVDWFQGQFRNKLTCLTCSTTSTTYNAFMYLSLPIPPPHHSGQPVSLSSCLDAFVKEEILEKQDAWHCPRCKKPRRATKRLSISRLPMILLIHLKRFSFKGPFTDKIETTVSFPLQNLDLTNYVPSPLPPSLARSAARDVPISRSQQPPFLYDVFGVVHHHGNLSTGHYTASIRNAGGEWWYADDSRVTQGRGVVERQMGSSSPYVLFLRRRSG